MKRFIFVLFLAPLLLGGCSGIGDTLLGKKKEPPACPPVYILGDAAKLTKYRPGTGRDLTDVEGEAEIAGFQGGCTFNEQGDVLVDIQVAFQASRGPADTDRKLDLVYFVAMPGFFPSPAAKAEMPISIVFPEGATYARHIDEVVTLSIPIAPDAVAEKFEIYIGFQTTPEELEMNRRQKR